MQFKNIEINFQGVRKRRYFGIIEWKSLKINVESIKNSVKADLLTLEDIYSQNIVNIKVYIQNFNFMKKKSIWVMLPIPGLAILLGAPTYSIEIEGNISIEISDYNNLIYRYNKFKKFKESTSLYRGKNFNKCLNLFVNESVGELKEKIIQDKDDILLAYKKINRPETEEIVDVNKKPSIRKIDISDVDINIPKVKNKLKDGVAVIIGNKDYKNSDIPNVDFASNDALILKKYIINTLGYKEEDVIYEENATKAKFETIFGVKDNYKGKLYNWIKPNETDVFIYYVGHGAPDIKNNKAYFVPVDSDPSTISLNGYSIDTFYENISKLPYKTLTVIIDACFSGTSQKGLLVKNISPAGIEVDNPIMELPNSSIFLSSSGKEYSSWYEKKGHSLFTYYFLKGLKGEADFNNDKKLTVGELKNYINEEVPYKARRLNNIEQTPQFYGNENKVILEY